MQDKDIIIDRIRKLFNEEFGHKDTFEFYDEYDGKVGMEHLC